MADRNNTLLVTGGAGFIGSCFVLKMIGKGLQVINLDKLTYLGNLENLKTLFSNPNHIFVKGDIGDSNLGRGLLEKYKPSAVVNFAAESHVDSSIVDPDKCTRDENIASDGDGVEGKPFYCKER